MLIISKYRRRFGWVFVAEIRLHDFRRRRRSSKSSFSGCRSKSSKSSSIFHDHVPLSNGWADCRLKWMALKWLTFWPTLHWHAWWSAVSWCLCPWECRWSPLWIEAKGRLGWNFKKSQWGFCWPDTWDCATGGGKEAVDYHHKCKLHCLSCRFDFCTMIPIVYHYTN